MLAKCDKTRGHKENRILSSIYAILFQSTLDNIVLIQLNALHTVLLQDSDGMSINNLHVQKHTMHTCVMSQSAYKAL